MVQGMAFLSKKRFNPQNLYNQKAVWEARQEKEHEAKRLQERAEQLKRERDDEELARARGGARGGNEAALRFMYGPPPGLPAEEKKKSNSSSEIAADVSEKQAAETHDRNDLTRRQPGDDDAAAEFRRMLAAASEPAEDGSEAADQANSANQSSGISGAALAGTTIEAAAKGNESLSALEKAVGRKDANKSLTLEEQIARFPQLKNAPMARGMNATNVNVNFKPLGTQLRHIRCMACGVWGHSRGDRECEKSGWNPFASTSTAKPVAVNNELQQTSKSGLIPDKKSKRDRNRDRENDSSSTDSSGEEAYRRRRKREKKHKSSSRRRRREERRRRRSRSPSEDRKSRKKSHKRRRKHSSRDD